MRAYPAASEDAVHCHDLLLDWVQAGQLTANQFHAMDAPSDLRRANIFLRIGLFVFTLISVGAILGFFLALLLARPSPLISGSMSLIFAGVSYALAEFSAKERRCYRYGVEEALGTSAIGLLCSGLSLIGVGQSPIAVVGLLASLWVWHRFGLAYAPLGAMAFAAWFAVEATYLPMDRRILTVALFAIGLAFVIWRRRGYRLTFLEREYAIAEALLWLGIYAATNLKILTLDTPAVGWPRLFYWSTWAAVWCLPVILLARGILTRDRYAIWAGAVSSIATLTTNRLYFGWPSHTWDPMILGAILTTAALLLRRYLGEGIRHGFTAESLLSRKQPLIDLTSSAISFAAPSALPPPLPGQSEFGGGDTGGAGATSDF